MTCIHLALNGWFWNRLDVGINQYTKWLVWGLLRASQNIAITLVTPDTLKPTLQEAFGRIAPQVNTSNLKILVKPTPFPRQRSPLARLWFEQITFPKSCRTLKPDLIHIPYYGAPLRPVKPQIITAHDLIPLLLPEYKKEPMLRLYGRFIASTLPKADLILTPSNASRDDIHRHLKINQNRIRVTYEAPSPIFTICQDNRQTVQKYSLPPYYILYLGGYERRKNVETLIRAFHQAKPDLPTQTNLVLAGKLPAKESPTHQDPRPLIHQLNLENDVILTGWIPEDDLPALYHSADLFVYPSRYEGFGLPVLEAMACGTAVLTTNVTSLPEITGPAAAHVAPDDIDGMANQITALINNRPANRRLVESGYEHLKQFSWQKTAEQTIQAYQDTINIASSYNLENQLEQKQ